MRKKNTSITFLTITIVSSLMFLSACSSNPTVKSTPVEKVPANSPVKSAQPSNTIQANDFDPRTVKAGDQIASLVVASVETAPASSLNADSYVDAAKIQFDGEIKVKGTYRYHSLESETQSGKILFEVDRTESFPRMKLSDNPQMQRSDSIVLTFKKENEKQQFGPPGSEGEATLVLSNYQVRYSQTDEKDTADVSQIVAVTTTSQPDPRQDESQKTKQQEANWITFNSEKYEQEHNLLNAFYQNELNETQEKGFDYSVAKEDLNDDGINELIVAIHHMYFTGAQSNSYLVIFPFVEGKLGKEIIIGPVNLDIDDKGNQHELGLYPEKGKGQWRDIIINGNIYSFKGEEYQSQ
ncbi:hypothetical protein [Brevibacillus dissolubilis]|uniref:hypothetical protein n=1 Tax=Brevibacillus dissolubilis TaxID=1844116 RepID=UPI001117358C|nr:hypothetical protein [Brevibacillus dissolubilis]